MNVYVCMYVCYMNCIRYQIVQLFCNGCLTEKLEGSAISSDCTPSTRGPSSVCDSVLVLLLLLLSELFESLSSLGCVSFVVSWLSWLWVVLSLFPFSWRFSLLSVLLLRQSKKLNRTVIQWTKCKPPIW